MNMHLYDLKVRNKTLLSVSSTKLHWCVGAILALIASLLWLYKDIVSNFLTRGMISVVLINSDSEASVTAEKCNAGHFRLLGMNSCHAQLNCNVIKAEMTVSEVIGAGAVKVVHRGSWAGHAVAVNTLATPVHINDFYHGLGMLRHLQNRVKVTQLVGACGEDNTFVTELHPLGSADKLEEVLGRVEYAKFNTLSVRFRLCQQYIGILHSLHTESDVDGARVMCDSNDINKTLSQFLVASDLSLVLNDVDALPLVSKTSGQLVKCGHRELFGDFVAPEQLWPFEDEDFDDDRMPGYNEKVDIWKVPDVCDTLIGSVKGSGKLRLQLLKMHLRCKSDEPSDRPSALDLLKFYDGVRVKLKL